MASVLYWKVLQQGLLKARPEFQRYGRQGVSSIEQTGGVVSLCQRTPAARDSTGNRRRNVVVGVFSQASNGRSFANLESVSKEQTNDKGNPTAEDFEVKSHEWLEKFESEDGSVSGESSGHSFGAGEELQSLYKETTADVDGECADTGEDAFSTSESRRTRRARITKEILELGTSPIEFLDTVENSTSQMFWTVVNILYQHSRAPEALMVFEWWKLQAGYVPREHYYTKFISNCGHAGMIEDGQKLFDDMIRLGIRPTAATYTSLLQGYSEAGNFDKAKELLTEMREVGLKPNAITYTGLMHSYGKQGYYNEMAKIFNDMKTYQILQPECAPTSVTYSALIQWYAKGGLFTRMEKALKEMISKEFEPDGAAVNAMVQGYAEVGLVKEMEKAYSLVRPFKVAVRVETVRAVAQAYIRKSYFYQLGVFASYLNKRRVKMGILVENLLLLSHAANFSMRGLAEVYVKLKESGFLGDITSFNIRALAFSRMQMYWDLRVTILEMLSEGVTPDIVTYGAVVDAYVAGNLESKLSEALQEMPNLDRVAKAQTDPLIYEAFGRGDFQVSSEELMLDKDIDPRFLTYANLVGYYLKKIEILSTKDVRNQSGSF